MKHVFLIHSNTVLLSALGAIECEKICKNDILFLYSRHFTSSIVDRNILTIDISQLHLLSTNAQFVSSFSEHRRLIRGADDLIEKYVNDEFEIYIPHYSSPIFTVFLTNKLCKSTNLLQEGAFSFFGKPTRIVKTYIKNAVFGSNRIWWGTTWDMPKGKENIIKLRKTYAIDTKFFAPLEQAEHVIVKWPRIKDNRFIFPEYSNFLLFESAVEQSFLTIDEYVGCINKLMDENHINNCFLKFHPGQLEKNVNRILHLFDGINYKIIDNSIPFELILSSNRNLNLYGFSTSLLKFGEDMGHHVTSYLDVMCQVSERFRIHIEQGTYRQ